MKVPEQHERESLEDRLPTLAPEAIKFLQVFSSLPSALSLVGSNFILAHSSLDI